MRPSRAHASQASTSMRSQWESLVCSAPTRDMSGSVYRGITTLPPRASGAKSLRQRFLELVDLGAHARVADGDDLGREDGRVDGAVDGDGGDRHALGHLHGGV